MKVSSRIVRTTVGLALALCGAVSAAYAHDCTCAWAYGNSAPTSANSWILPTQVNAQFGCTRQQQCTDLCNQPGDISQSDSSGAAAVASYCTAHNMTSGQLVNVYLKSQAGGVTGAGVFGCEGWQDAGQTYPANCPGGPATPSPDVAIDTTTAANLKNLRSLDRVWALKCATDGTLSDSTTDCDFGDMTLFAGISCGAGEQSRCINDQSSQGPDGRWWRNPKSIGSTALYSFSRDATYGVLDYLLTVNQTNHAKAVGEATKWMHWVQSHGDTTCTTIPVVSTSNLDDRCLLQVDPATWALVGEVMQAIGVPLTIPNQLTMPTAVTLQQGILLAEAGTVGTGYTLHLVGLETMLINRLRREYGMHLTDPQPIADILALRQPINPFFAYLKKGRKEGVAETVLNLCPAVIPTPVAPATTVVFDWAWQRQDSDQVWQRSMGWDCIFMVNLLLGPGPDAPPTCPSPMALVNGVCQCPAGTSPAGTNLAGSEVCSCPTNGQTFANGECTNTSCPTGQSWNPTEGGGGICCPAGSFQSENGGQCSVACAANVVYSRRGNLCCGVGQILDSGDNCVNCPNNQVSTGVGACGCSGNMLLQSNGTCACPLGSSLNSAGVCQCAGNQTIVGGQCVCPFNEAVIGGTCAHCPTNEVVSNGSCVCPSPFIVTNGLCVPASTGH